MAIDNCIKPEWQVNKNCKARQSKSVKTPSFGRLSIGQFYKYPEVPRNQSLCQFNHLVQADQWPRFVHAIGPDFAPRFKLLPMRKIFFDLVKEFITNRKYAFFCVFQVWSSPDNIILMYWIEINHVLL